VSNGRDEIDTWLEREVTPLMPPHGTLDQIRRTARRRKTTQAVFAAAGCAVVIGAAAAAPALLAGQHHSPGSQTTPAAAQDSPSYSVSIRAGSPSPMSQSASSPAESGTKRSYLSATTSGVPVPANFRPTSVTFVGNGSGGEVGAVIGQAGAAGHSCSTRYCTSLAGTSTYGTSWYGVSAPVAPGASSAAGVSQLRFDNLRDGWAFGPALYETSKGGWPWQREIPPAGQRVTDLETASGSALAVFATCTGTGEDYAAGCTSFSLYSSAAGSTTWTPVAVPAAFRAMTTSVGSAATLVISGGNTGYLLTPSKAILTGPVTGGTWTQAGTAPCRPTGAQADGQPKGAQLASASGPVLVLACGGGSSTAMIYTSATGATWTRVGQVGTAGQPTSLSAASTSTVVLATTSGIDYSADLGASWHAAKITGSPPGGFTYVGMTTPTIGVAVPADANLNEVFVTNDGGQTWSASTVR
jgi:hypothetical protein